MLAHRLGKPTWGQHRELGNLFDVTNPRITKQGVQGFINNLDLMGQLGELAYAGLQPQDVKKLAKSFYLRAFDLENRVPLHFQTPLFGFLRMLVAFDRSTSDLKAALDVFFNPRVRLTMPDFVGDAFRAEYNYHVGCHYLRYNGDELSKMYWYPGVVMTPDLGALWNMMDLGIVSLCGISEDDFITEYQYGEYAKHHESTPPKFLLFPSETSHTFPRELKLAENLCRKLAEKFHEKGLACCVREATLWELIFFWCPLQYGLTSRGFPFWGSAKASFKSNHHVDPVTLKIEFDREGKGATVSKPGEESEEPGFIPVVEVL